MALGVGWGSYTILMEPGSSSSSSSSSSRHMEGGGAQQAHQWCLMYWTQ
jgi:hypothetical protein